MINTKLLAVLLFLSAGLSVQSQFPFPNGSTWHYNYFSAYQFSFEQRIGYDLLSVSGEMEIEGEVCQVITRDRNYWTTSTLGGPSEWTGPITESLTDQYVYSSGDTTFYYANEQFYIMYIMDAVVGASWESFAINGEDIMGEPGEYTYTTRVMNSGTVEFNGEMRRYIDIEGDASECNWGEIGRIIEGVGLLSPQYQAYFFPDYTWILGCYGLSETETFGLNCFESDVDELYMQVDHCASGPVGLTELELVEVSISPNPSSDWIEISTTESIEAIRWLDGFGRVIQELSRQDTATRLDVSQFKAGVYFIQVLREGRWLPSSQRMVKL